MKKQNKISLFKRKGFYTAAIVIISLLIIADIAIGLLPVASNRMGDGYLQDFSMPPDRELSSDMQMPDMNGGENLPGTGAAGTQSKTLLQRLKTVWFPVAAVLALLDLQCILIRLRLGKREKKQKEMIPEAVHGDGEVHLTPKKKKTHRHSPWWWTAPVAVMLVLALVVQFFSGSTAEELPRTEASILSGSAARSDLEITLPGSGTLTEETAESVTLAGGVEVSKWYVSDGDIVAEGEKIAAVDRVSVMAAIATVQDTIEELDDTLSDWESETLSSKLTSPTAGRVKEIYVETGASVVDVMYEYGALMRISMDGMMAVNVETDADLSAGDSLIVTLADGTEEIGRVESVTNGTAVITLTDDGPQRGDVVTVSTEAGETLGSGSLYIHSELKVTAYTGTVKSVSVKEEQVISGGQVLLYLKDRENVAAYESLLAQRGKLEKQMAELFQLYQSGMLYAPCGGMVSGVEDYIAANLSVTGGAQITLLANAPGDDPDASYANFVGKVAAVESGVWQVNLSPSSWEITDYALLAQMNIPDELLTESITYTPSGAPLYIRSGGTWVSASASQVKAGDTVLFAFDPTDTSRLVWIVVIPGTADTPPAETEPAVPDATDPTVPDTTEPDSTEPATPSEGAEPTQPSTSGQGQMPSGSGGGMGGGFSSGGTQQEENTVYEVTEEQALTITPQNTMQITITVDELDILTLKAGQTAQVTLDAMPGQSFTGTVAQLSLSGSNSGGNSKYTAVIEIPRTEQMLPGMNASVSVMLESHTGLLTVPVDALVEQDGKVYLFTTYDEKTDTLGGLTEVSTGLSDGKSVQILSGISEGDIYYYSYLDTVNYETSIAGSSGIGFSFGPMR